MENSVKMSQKPLTLVASAAGVGLEGSGVGCVGDFFISTHLYNLSVFTKCVCVYSQ